MRKTQSLLLMILFVFGCLHGAQDLTKATSPLYKVFVKQVTYETAGFDTMALIELSDGSQWKFVAHPQNDLTLNNLVEEIIPGKEVSLCVEKHDPSYWLCEKTKCFKVFISKKSLPNFLTIQKIEKISKPCNGWFTSEEPAILITLSDSSQWEFSNFEKEKAVFKWELGNHVFVSRFGDEFTLLNVNAKFYDIWTSSDLRVPSYSTTIKLITPPNQ